MSGPPSAFCSRGGTQGVAAEKGQEGRGGRTRAKLAAAAVHQPTDTGAGLCPSPLL
jgi:hypothetical protein